MQLFCRHSSIIIIMIIVVFTYAVGQLKSFQPQKPQFLSFENNTGPTKQPTDRATDQPTDRHDLL